LAAQRDRAGKVGLATAVTSTALNSRSFKLREGGQPDAAQHFADLVAVWQQQNKRQKGHDLLAPVYSWFTEGFDTADLQEAKAFLEALKR
jgi:predicted ATPase